MDIDINLIEFRIQGRGRNRKAEADKITFRVRCIQMQTLE